MLFIGTRDRHKADNAERQDYQSKLDSVGLKLSAKWLCAVGTWTIKGGKSE